jgi:hypothetical protein
LDRRRGSATASGTLLGGFFSELSRRAKRDPLADAAWAQLERAGFGLRSGAFVLGGRPATGGEVERALAAEMGRGALRTWQLVAAADWWQRLGLSSETDPARQAALFGLAINRPAWLARLRPATGDIDAPSLVERIVALYPRREREARAARYATALLLR